MTTQTLTVLALFLSDPAGEWYGFDIADRTRLKTGTLYPLLARLEKEGWLHSRWEDLDPHEAGRPRRRLYTLTGHGREAARRELTSQVETLAAPLGQVLRPAPRERIA
jgi:PadR family transcriptional regulator